jgi:hypoxanthine phosphoribosyltransferase
MRLRFWPTHFSEGTYQISCVDTLRPRNLKLRTTGQSVDHLNQLNTIYVEQHPIKDKKGGRYKTSPLRAGKSVLVVDDICTQGNSFEAARAFIRGTGAETICLSWLKTINTDYRALGANPTVQDPYKSYAFQALPAVVDYPFSTSIRNNAATVNLDEIFQSYYQWDWPN